MGLGCDWGGKDRVVGNWDDVEAVWVKGVECNCAVIGNGRDVPEILLEGQGCPMEGVLNGLSIDASGVQADTSANAAQVSCPLVKGRLVDNSIDTLGGGPEGSCDVLGLDKSDGASWEAVGGEEGKGVCQGKVEIKPTLDNTHEGRDRE